TLGAILVWGPNRFGDEKQLCRHSQAGYTRFCEMHPTINNQQSTPDPTPPSTREPRQSKREAGPSVRQPASTQARATEQQWVGLTAVEQPVSTQLSFHDKPVAEPHTSQVIDKLLG